MCLCLKILLNELFNFGLQFLLYNKKYICACIIVLMQLISKLTNIYLKYGMTTNYLFSIYTLKIFKKINEIKNKLKPMN